MRKKVVSFCCDAPIHHFPSLGMGPMDMTIFFCDKCSKVCKTKVVKPEEVIGDKGIS